MIGSMTPWPSFVLKIFFREVQEQICTLDSRMDQTSPEREGVLVHFIFFVLSMNRVYKHIQQ